MCVCVCVCVCGVYVCVCACVRVCVCVCEPNHLNHVHVQFADDLHEIARFRLLPSEFFLLYINR